MLMLRALWIAVPFLFLTTTHAWAVPAQVVLIRHAEEPNGEEGSELSPRGWERARALVGLFTQDEKLNEHGHPSAIFGMAPKSKEGTIRSIQTVTPLSEQFHVEIHQKFDKEEIHKLVSRLLEDKDGEYDGKMVVVCWKHAGIPEIAKKLGFKDAPKEWPEGKFDRLWILNFKDGKPSTFEDRPQNLLPGDSAE